MARTVKPWVGKTDDSMPHRDVRLRIAGRQGDACASCRMPLDQVKGPRQCDHIIALADGGENVEANLQILCTPCHGTKTKAEAGQRARVRSLKAKRLGLDTKTSPRSTFRKPPAGTRYEQGPFGLRPVRGDAR